MRSLLNPYSITSTLSSRVELTHLYKMFILYMACWLAVYLDLAQPIRLLIAILLIAFQFTSYRNACFVMLLVFTIPFMNDLLGAETSGLKFQRLVSFPFLMLSMMAPKQRVLPMNPTTFILLLAALLVIIVHSDIQEIVQDVPLSPGQTEKLGMKNFIAQFFDNSIKLLFLYFVFTRLSTKEINSVYLLILFFGLCQGATLIFLVSKNPEMVLDYGTNSFGKSFDKDVLWKNPFFGHKNDWGMYTVLILYMALIKNLLEKKLGWFFLLVMAVALVTTGLSLSRQAYVFTAMGFILMTVWKRNFKIVLYFLAVVAVIVITKPDFIFNRMEEFTSVSSGDDFQNLSRKVSDLAFDQAAENFAILPRMYVEEWEYNWSEGFWNGYLHQVGIIGFFFLIYIYYYLFQRASVFHKCKRENLSHIGMLLKIILVIMFLGNFNRRDTNFMNYYGNIRQIGFLGLFMVFYSEFLFHSIGKRVKQIQRIKRLVAAEADSKESEKDDETTK